MAPSQCRSRASRHPAREGVPRKGGYMRIARLVILIMVIALTGQTGLLRSGVGDPGFFPPVLVGPAVPVESVATGDFNGDLRPDLAAADFASNQVMVFLGRGDGTFQDASLLAAGSGPSWVAAGDLNADGFPDLAATNRLSNDVSVFLGNGDGSFGVEMRFMTGLGPASIAI